MSAKRKPGRPNWERPGQSSEDFKSEVARRVAETPTRFGLDACGVDFLENLHQTAIQGVNAANAGIKAGEEVEFNEMERAFCQGIAFAIRALRSGSIRRAS